MSDDPEHFCDTPGHEDRPAVDKDTVQGETYWLCVQCSEGGKSRGDGSEV
jgi:hypothetical protein